MSLGVTKVNAKFFVFVLFLFYFYFLSHHIALAELVLST